MKKNYFVAGTDTDAGKTLISEALLLKANELGLRSLGLKPVAAGSQLEDGQLVNDDAQRLLKAASVDVPYQQVNPVLFDEAIAPHIAAAHEKRRMSVRGLTGFVRGAMMKPYDVAIIEGAGGWLVPINDRETLNGLAKELELEVILVVGLKLGCLNHALLTAQAIKQDGLRMSGWVATQVDADMLCVDENVASLNAMLNAPCLGVIPYQKDITAQAVLPLINLPE